MKYFAFLFFLLSGALNSQNYHYAIDDAPAKPDTEPPTTPINLIVDNIGLTTVNLTWIAATDNIGVQGYNIYEVTNNEIRLIETIGNVNTYTLTGLTQGENYTIFIRAFDPSGNQSANSNSESFLTNIGSDTIVPTMPLNLVSSNITQNTADLSWTPATDNIGVQGYNIYEVTNNETRLLATIGNVNNHTLTELTQGENYTIFIRAFDPSGNQSANSNSESFTTNIALDIIVPTAPLNLVVSNITQNTADLSWTPATDNIGVQGYNIYNGTTLLQTTGNVNTYSLTSLIPNENYSIVVKAFDSSGNFSKNSNIESFRTLSNPDTAPPTMPLNLTANNITASSVDLSWNPSSDNVGVTEYRIYNNGNLITTESIISTTYSLKDLNSETLYEFTVRAVDAKNNESLDSNQIAVTTTSITFNFEHIRASDNIVVSNLVDGYVNVMDAFTTFNVNVIPSESVGSISLSLSGNIIEERIENTSPYTLYGDNGVEDFTSGPNLPEGNYTLTAVAWSRSNSSGIQLAQESISFVVAPNESVFPKVNENTPPEIDYFNAFYLPASQASNLQNALNTHGAVRLGKGDYTSSGNISITSNQKLYGWLGEAGTTLGHFNEITIEAGSKNVHIENIDANIIFESGATISDVTLQSIYYADIICQDCRIENNYFRDLSRVQIKWDCSNSGFFRNNIFVKVFEQTFDDHVTMIGNSTEPSYGNIELSRNLLTSKANTTHYENIETHTLLGYDAENWAYNAGSSAKAAFYFRGIGKLQMFNGNGYSGSGSPEFDIEASQLIMNRRVLGSKTNPIVRTGTNFLSIFNRGNRNVKENGVWEFLAHSNNDITEINDVNISSILNDSQKLKEDDALILEDLILGKKHTPINKPSFHNVPDPLGANWSELRNGKIDQSEEIQALINANGIAELDEGTYFISKSLILQDGQGIIGKGTGKTVILGLTDNFPLIKCEDDVSAGDDPNNSFSGQKTNIIYKVAYMTLQGGSVGIYVKPKGNDINYLQVTNTPWRHLVFRNQDYGIHLDSFYGFDNNFLYNLHFVNCKTGFFQESQRRPATQTSGEWSTMMYVDKTMFYKCQFINCDTGIDMQAVRANNLNAWVDCNYESNNIAMYTSSSNGLYCANTSFKNQKGDAVIKGNASMSFYSCDFTNNNTSTLFSDKYSIHAEGCNFSDNIPFNTFAVRQNREYYLWNNTISNNVDFSGVAKGYLINNKFTNDNSNPNDSKLMIEIISGTTRTILDQSSNPYPQLLVKQ